MIVFDTGTGQLIEVTKAQAVAGLLRYAHTFPAGSAVRAEWERQAAALAAGTPDDQPDNYYTEADR